MKKYYSISDVSAMFNLEAHKLRYIEKIVPNLKINKLRGRRYYTEENIKTLQNFIPSLNLSENSSKQNNYYLILQVNQLLIKFKKIRDIISPLVK